METTCLTLFYLLHSSHYNKPIAPPTSLTLDGSTTFFYPNKHDIAST